ncbi:MAG: energy transducer TonB [Betaproteobacteria bacterium]|nr:energy transducer TonB [Betaproteobacteria bacterium]
MLPRAIMGSMLLHAIFVTVIPNFEFESSKKPDVITVELIKKPEPPPVIVPPEPAPPEPIKPPPKPIPRPVVKHLPTPAVEKREPVLQQPVVTPQPEIISVAPKVEAPAPVQTVPVSMPSQTLVKQDPPPPTFSQADMEDAKNQYGLALWGAISKHKKYPKIAQMRGWQGEVIIEIQVDGNGHLKSKKVEQSSGYEILDKQALEMVEKALPFPVPPEALRSNSFTITVPVPFKLENS